MGWDGKWRYGVDGDVIDSWWRGYHGLMNAVAGGGRFVCGGGRDDRLCLGWRWISGLRSSRRVAMGGMGDNPCPD